MKNSGLLLLVLLAFVAVLPASAKSQRTPARLCDSCAFGSKYQNCIKCGRWAPNNFSTAYICNSCGFGSKAQNCVKCGKWAPNHYKEARLCNNCAFGSKKDECVICGKYIP